MLVDTKVRPSALLFPGKQWSENNTPPAGLDLVNNWAVCGARGPRHTHTLESKSLVLILGVGQLLSSLLSTHSREVIPAAALTGLASPVSQLTQKYISLTVLTITYIRTSPWHPHLADHHLYTLIIQMKMLKCLHCITQVSQQELSAMISEMLHLHPGPVSVHGYCPILMSRALQWLRTVCQAPIFLPCQSYCHKYMV